MVKRISIVTKMVVILLMVSLGSVGVMSWIGLSGITKIGEMIIKDSTKALESKTKEHLERIVADKTAFCERVLNEIKDLICAEQAFVLDVYNNPTDYQYVEQYRDDKYPKQPGDPVPEGAPPDLQYSDRYQRMVSFKYLNIKPAPGVNLTYNTNNHLFSLDPEINKVLHTFSQMIAFFRTASIEHPTIKWVYFGTPAGLHFCYPGHGPYDASYDCRLRGWYKRAVESGEFGWSDPYVDASGTGLMITASRPVYDSNNKLLGVVAADVTIDTINNEIINLKIGETGYPYLIDGKGAVIAKPEYEAGDVRWDEAYPLEYRHNTTNEELNAVTLKMMNGESGSTVITLGGEKKYTVYAPIKELGWGLAAVLPVDEALEDVKKTEKNLENSMRAVTTSMLLTTIPLVIIVVIICMVFGRTITRPLSRLKEITDKIVKGELDTMVDVKSKDEIGSLAQSFDTMRSAVKKSRDELESHSRELEKQVAERTKELEKSKKELESKVDELERFSRLSVGRELKMIELKKKIKGLEKQLEGNPNNRKNYV